MHKLLISIFLCCVCTAASYSQDNETIAIANEYYGSGEFKKAMDLYHKLAQNKRNITIIHNNYFFLLLEFSEFKKAERYINKLIKQAPHNLYYKMDRGLVYWKAGNKEKADLIFKRYINQIQTNSYQTRISAQYFVNKQLTDYAILTYETGRNAMSNEYLYSLELANVYRILNNKEKMVAEYLNFVVQNPSNLNYVRNSLQNLLTQPEEYTIFENLLYDKIHEDPDNDVYAELLIWVNLQQKNFYGAFIQARAIDKRKNSQGARSNRIGLIALENADYKTSIKIFSYVIREYPGTVNYIMAKMYLIRSYEEDVRNTYPVDEREIRNLIADYNRFINELGINRNTLEALRNKAQLHAFYLQEYDSAVTILKRIIDIPQVSDKLKSSAKLDLGDIYILTNEPWESSLLYSQVEKENKETPQGYEAKLKNAKLWYYTGEFKLALNHLDILKEATSRRIANDAMELSVLIKDNLYIDTVGTALKMFAKADLYLYKNNYDSAFTILSTILVDYEGHSLTDEIHYRLGEIHMKTGQFDKAIASFKIVSENYPHDIYGDDAHFMIATIYDRQLSWEEKAMEYYLSFLTKFPGSLHIAEARKRLRILRGDFESPSTESSLENF